MIKVLKMHAFYKEYHFDGCFIECTKKPHSELEPYYELSGCDCGINDKEFLLEQIDLRNKEIERITREMTMRKVYEVDIRILRKVLK